MELIQQLSQELKLRPAQVEAAVRLLDEGNTIPFIARYRKEMTDSLDDAALRDLSDRLEYLRNLQKRREEVIRSITEQEKLTPELETAIQAAATLAEVEDLYRPYKPKRRTRSAIAREKGLEPLGGGHPVRIPCGSRLAGRRVCEPGKGRGDRRGCSLRRYGYHRGGYFR